jgi:hypothetical protein
MQEPNWSGWKSHIPSGIRYVSYRVAFGFQMPDLEWPGAVSLIDCPPSLIVFLGSHIFRIGSPSDSRYKSLSGQGGNPIFRVGSNIFRIGSPSDSRCQK